MKKDGYQLGIYEFLTKEEYKEAKKEQEAVDFIKAKGEYTDPANALRLYNKMVAKRLFGTHIGYDFMKELRKIAVDGGIVTEDRLYPMPVLPKKNEAKKEAVSKEQKERKELEEEAKRYKILYEDLKGKKYSSRVVIVFLIIMLIAMVVITLMSDNTLITDYRSKIENEYVTWQEELEEKERELNEREEKLKQEGGYVQ